MMVDQYQHIGSGSFLILSYSTFDLSQKQIWTFLTFDPLTQFWWRGHHERFLMVDLDQHTDIVRFVVEGCLKFDLQLWPQNDLGSKIPGHLKEPMAKDLFTQVSSKSIESCRRKRFLSVFEQRSQMTPRWPSTPNLWTPLLSPTWWLLCPSIMRIISVHIQKAFSNCEQIDR